jgi:hypothetical protein
LIVVHHLNLVEMAIFIVLNNVEDKRTFSIVSFTKSKLHNCFTVHLDLVVKRYAQQFYKLQIFLFYITIQKVEEGEVML